MAQLVQDETPQERRKRQKREAMARWYAKPENRQKFLDAQKEPHAVERRKEANARWYAKPENREKVIERSKAQYARRKADKTASAMAEELGASASSGNI